MGIEERFNHVIGESERLEATHSEEGESTRVDYAATDRRILTRRQKGKEELQVRSLPYEQVTGVQLEVERPESGMAKLIGVVVGAIGFVMMVIGGSASDGGGLIGLGIIFLLLGIAIAIFGDGKREGEVSVTLAGKDRGNTTFGLSESGLGWAESVTALIGDSR